MSSEKSSSHVAKSSVTFGTGEFAEKPFKKCGIPRVVLGGLKI
jgi:hypothetical protein